MAFASFDRKSSAAPVSDINMVPLIDVMLVLLVIFIVTAPLLTHAVKLDLPKASSRVNELKPDKIEFAIDADDLLFFNNDGERVLEPGRFAVWIGGDSTATLGGQFELMGGPSARQTPPAVARTAKQDESSE